MFGIGPPALWYGFCDDGPGYLLGIGGAYRAEDGRWWLFLQRAPTVRRLKTCHRAGRLVVDVARDAGISLCAMGDKSLPRCELWIAKLGFQKTGDSIEGHDVWTL